ALPAAPSLAAYAGPLAIVCHLEGVERVDVVGHSLGAVVALRLAARRPALVRRLVLAAAAGISSATRRAEVFLTTAALVQPGRRLGRFTEAIVRSPTLRRLAFTRFAVSDPLALSARSVRGLLLPPREHTDTLSA